MRLGCSLLLPLRRVSRWIEREGLKVREAKSQKLWISCRRDQLLRKAPNQADQPPA